MDVSADTPSTPSDNSSDQIDQIPGGRYHTVERLSTGAIGAVYKALDTILDRPVAVKCVRLDTPFADQTPDELRERFVREARVAARLQHPNIVTIHDIVATPDRGYIIMEFIQGRTLESLLASEKRLPLSAAIQILGQLAQALDYAHGCKVVHRDVKPSNILVSPSMYAWVTDFGIAKSELSTNLTMAGGVLGAPDYMSPEQAKGEDVDARSDLFSLGCILFEAAVGEKPFRSPSLTGVLLSIINDEPVFPLNWRSLGLPNELKPILHHALEKDPDKRFDSGEAMIRALEAMPAEAIRRADETVSGSVAAKTDAPATEGEAPKATDEANAKAKKAEDDAKRQAEEEAEREAEAKAKEKAEREAEEKSKREADKKAKRDAAEKAKREADEKAKREADEKAKREADEKAKREAEKKAKREAEKKAKREAEEKAKREAEEKAKREAEEKAKREAEEKAKRETKAKAKREAREKAEREAEEKAKRKAEEKAEREAEEKAKREADEKAEREAEEKAKREAEEKAEREAEEKAKREAEEKAEREAEEKAKREAEERAERKAEEEAAAKAEAEAAESEASDKASEPAAEGEESDEFASMLPAPELVAAASGDAETSDGASPSIASDTENEGETLPMPTLGQAKTSDDSSPDDSSAAEDAAAVDEPSDTAEADTAETADDAESAADNAEEASESSSSESSAEIDPARIDELKEESQVLHLDADLPSKLQGLQITPEEGFILSRIDGASRPGDVLSVSPMPENDTARALLDLLEKGLIRLGGVASDVKSETSADTSKPDKPKEPEPPSKAKGVPDDATVQEVERLLALAADHDYAGVLGVSRSATEAERKKAYLKIVAKYHPDRFPNADDGTQDKLSSLCAAASEAVTEAEKQQDEEPPKTSATKPQSSSGASGNNGSEDIDTSASGAFDKKKYARELYGRALTAFEHADYWESIQIGRQAVEADDGEADYYALLGRALMQNKKWRKEAADKFRKASELEPHNVEYLGLLGAIYKAEGLATRANAILEKARMLDPDYEFPELDAEPEVS